MSNFRGHMITFAMRADALSAHAQAAAQLWLLHAQTCVAAREERQERGHAVRRQNQLARVASILDSRLQKLQERISHRRRAVRASENSRQR